MREVGRVVLVAVVAAMLLPSARFAHPHPIPAAPECPMFPPDNHWNLRVDQLPKHPNSDAIVRSIGRTEGLHPDFGSGLYEGAPIGIPYVVVAADQEEVPITFQYADESDEGPYPIPPDAPIEGGPDGDGDRHVIVVDKDECKLWEVFAAYPHDGGERWTAGSGATWNLNSNALREKGWTSADAAGLPILPGLARYSDVEQGSIDHALRFTVERSRRKFIYPARHFASSLTSRNLPAMGQRLRLKRGFDISGFSPQAKIVLTALKHYGMIMADNGSDWFISGEPNENWDNDDLRELKDVLGKNFVVVDTSQLPKPD